MWLDSCWRKLKRSERFDFGVAAAVWRAECDSKHRLVRMGLGKQSPGSLSATIHSDNRRQESCMVYADTGVGKSLFALSAALAVAGGGEFLGWAPEEKANGPG